MHERWVGCPDEEKEKARAEALKFFKKAEAIRPILEDYSNEKLLKDLQDSINSFLFICTQILDRELGTKVRLSAGEFLVGTVQSELEPEAKESDDHFHYWYIGTKKAEEKKNPIPDDVH